MNLYLYNLPVVIVAVDHALDRLAPKVAGDVLGGPAGGGLDHAWDQTRVVGRAKNVRQVEERVVGSELAVGQRLDPPRVDARLEIGVRHQMLVQRVLVHDVPTGHIDQDG